MVEHLLGLHEGCGGSVYETDKTCGGRVCGGCGAEGAAALLMSEIFTGDDLTPVTPMAAMTRVPDEIEVDIDVDIETDDLVVEIEIMKANG